MLHQTLETALELSDSGCFSGSHAGKAAVFIDCYRRLASLPYVYWHAHLPSKELTSGHWKDFQPVDLHNSA